MPVVCYKIHLIDERTGLKETRKFLFNQYETNLSAFQEKLQTLFPTLRGQNLTICWKDADGDTITIASNEELEIALSDIKHNQTSSSGIAFYVSVKSDKDRSPPSTRHQELHFNIVCDGCDGDIQGFRYKCIQCEDYDLCSECETRGLHSHHNMIRISRPLKWSSHYNRSLMRHIRKLLEKQDAHSGKEDYKEECPMRGKRHHDKFVRYGNGPTWVNLYSYFMNELSNIVSEGTTKDTTAKKPEAQSSNGDGPSNDVPKQDERKDAKEHLVLKVSADNIIKRILDPFGAIDIEITSDKSENDGQCDSTAKKTESQGPSTEESTSKKFHDEDKKLIDNTKSDNQSASSATSVKNSDVAEKESEVAQGWTIVDRRESSNISYSTSASSSLNETATTQIAPSAPLEIPDTEKIYPPLPKKEESVTPHPDPKIQRAVETMVSMGFSNKSGFLTYLLESEDGNISKVLDFLHASQ